MKNKNYESRRNFLKQLVAGTFGLAIANRLFPLVGATPFPAGGTKSKVILVKNPGAIRADGQVNPALIREMLNKGMLSLSGKSSPAEAWSQFFNPDELVGLKVNVLGLNTISGSELTQHFSAVSSAIVDGLKTSGLPEKNMIIWDRSDEEMINAGFKISRAESGLRIMGTRTERKGAAEGFHPESYPVGDSSTRIHTLITDVSSFINIPVLKTHTIAGITGSLKNHYGSIDNPRDFHANNATDPGIPEINTISVIRKKQKLIICDALLGVFDEGPVWNTDKIWPFGGMIFGTDPVAIDTVMFDILEKKRKAEGLPSLADSAIHLPLSEKLGLGNHNRENIDLVEITLK